MGVEIKGFECWTAKRIYAGTRIGDFELAAIETSVISGESRFVWVCSDTNSVIRERCEVGKPFKGIMLDSDGTMFDSEGGNGIFAVCWRELFKSAGIQGSDDYIDNLKKRIYLWDKTLPISVQDMIRCIDQGVDIHNIPLETDSWEASRKLLDPKNLRRWAAENGRDYGLDPLKNSAAIIADRKEKIGIDILAVNPERVIQLAPFFPGVQEFVHKIPQRVPLAIASGTRIGTIRAILEANAKMGFVLGHDLAIVGEDTIIMPGFSKPEGMYYQVAAATACLYFSRDGFPVINDTQDIIFIGDTIAHSAIYDMPGDRKMHHIVINTGENTQLGPLAVGVSNFLSLLETMQKPIDKIDNFTLKRLEMTLK